MAGPNPLIWDSNRKVQRAGPGQVVADYVFTVVNSGDHPVEIKALLPACGCTLVTMPTSPWILGPGESGSFVAQLEFADKQGVMAKTIQVASSHGTQTLTIVIEVPESDEILRRKNQELAQLNRQSVFQGDCARCHAEPIAGKVGKDLYPGACGICHLAPARAPMVPDLRIARTRRDAAYWRKWITEGKEGTLMPGFAAAHGGPLTEEQIESLIVYALANLPTEPKALPSLGAVEKSTSAATP